MGAYEGMDVDHDLLDLRRLMGKAEEFRDRLRRNPHR